MELEELDSKVEVLIRKHSNVKDLNHVIGKDPGCLYCEQFKKLSRGQKRLQKLSTKNSKKEKVTLESVKVGSEKSLHEIIINDRSKFMVFAESIDEIARLLKVSV